MGSYGKVLLQFASNWAGLIDRQTATVGVYWEYPKVSADFNPKPNGKWVTVEEMHGWMASFRQRYMGRARTTYRPRSACRLCREKPEDEDERAWTRREKTRRRAIKPNQTSPVFPHLFTSLRFLFHCSSYMPTHHSHSLISSTKNSYLSFVSHFRSLHWKQIRIAAPRF